MRFGQKKKKWIIKLVKNKCPNVISVDQGINWKKRAYLNTVDLSFYERYRYRYQTLASFFKAFEIFIHRF